MKKKKQHDLAEGEVFIEGGEFDRPPRKPAKVVPTQVGRLFYAFGFLGASYPVAVILFSIVVVLLSCYPLWSIPTSTSGNRPKEFITVLGNYSSPTDLRDPDWPRWYKGPPAIFVQQILIKSFVHPWTTDLIITDAFRATLAETFQVVEVIKNDSFSTNERKPQRLSETCFRVSEVKSKALKGKIPMLPEHNCLIVSPANFWNGDYEKFQADSDILGTILKYQSNRRRRSGLAELLLGLNVKDTGFRKNPFRSKQKFVSYAITLILQKYDPKFVTELETRLKTFYASKLALSDEDQIHENGTSRRHSAQQHEKKVVHIFYPAQLNLLQLMPLIVTYITVFLYLYFSLKKVEMINSKLGMAFTALCAIITSLCMSVGLCTHFGVAYQVNAQAIFPYVAVIIGLENLLVLIRSVVSTAPHLDVKIRVAQGLSKEGWSIIKNLSAEVTILTIGFFTFIPQIQEFCILSIVGLLSDFFIQTFFFSTVLSIDIRRTEIRRGTQNPASAFTPFRKPIHPRLNRVKSNSTLPNGSTATGAGNNKTGGSLQVVAPSQLSPILVKIPKRLRVISFWARTRFFQRTFIICMVGWISCIIYESGIMHFEFNTQEADDIVIPNIHLDETATPKQPLVPLAQNMSGHPGRTMNRSVQLESFHLSENGTANEKYPAYSGKWINELRDCNPNTWRRLSWYHWQVLLGIYNVSLTGKYISILPPICATLTIDPRDAISRRNVHEQEQATKFNWQNLAALDQLDITEDNVHYPDRKTDEEGFFYSFSALDDPYIPTTPIELALVVLLAIPSAIFLSYSLIVVYRCVCTRNYAEWRSSWGPDNGQDYYTQVIFEAVPLVLDGHKEEVECMGSDGNIISSVCLDGVLKIWNLNNGDNIVTIDRKRYFCEGHNEYEPTSFVLGSDADSPIDSSPPNVNSTGHSIENEGTTRHRPPRQHTYSWSESEPSIHSMNNAGGGDSVGRTPSPSLQNNHPTHSRNDSFTQSELSFCQSSAPARDNEPLPHLGNHLLSNPMPILSSPIPIDCSSPQQQQLQQPTHRNYTKSGSLNTPPARRESEIHVTTARSNSRLESSSEMIYEDSQLNDIPPVWSLDCYENTVILGTGSGRIEFWDASTGQLKCTFDDENGIGITCLKVAGNKVVAAKINGSIDFLQLESRVVSRNEGSPSAYNRFPGHNPDGPENRPMIQDQDSELVCVWLSTQKAHQQPITCLDCDNVHIVTGSQDHCLKVFRLQDQLPFLSLHGHYGPITCVFVDKMSPLTLGSGSQDGLLCIWDLQTGMCMYSIQAHDGPINALTYSVSYIISAGGDDKICIWERFQGHLLNTIQLDHAYCSSLVMLTHNLLITSKQGSLVVCDVRSGEAVRVVRLGHRDSTVFVRQIMVCADAVLCDYGSQLRLVRFPSVISKVD